MNLIGADPKHDPFGIAGAKLAVAGHPERSVLLQRLGRVGPGRMPPLSSSIPDPLAIRLIGDWLTQLSNQDSQPKNGAIEPAPKTPN
ncbi:MAG: hypothetical protein U1D30_20105 [Planctomycetota bacterium]